MGFFVKTLNLIDILILLIILVHLLGLFFLYDHCMKWLYLCHLNKCSITLNLFKKMCGISFHKNMQLLELLNKTIFMLLLNWV